MLTPEGAELLLAIAAGIAQDALGAQATLVVSDGQQSASAALNEGYPRLEGGELTFCADFGADAANFEWAQRSIVSEGGVVVDTTIEDHGRKAPGSEWTLEATLELAPDEPDA